MSDHHNSRLPNPLQAQPVFSPPPKPGDETPDQYVASIQQFADYALRRGIISADSVPVSVADSGGDSLPSWNSLICSTPPFENQGLVAIDPAVIRRGSALPTSSQTVARYALLAAARDILLHDFNTGHPMIVHRRKNKRSSDRKLPHRACFCKRTVISEDKRVGLLHHPQAESASYKGLLACASIWLCPVCAAKITERRRVAYDAVFKSLSVSNPVVMLTLTLQHERDDTLAGLLEILLSSYDRMLTTGKTAAKFLKRWGILGRARSLEVTYGVNGWHVHLHVALILSVPLSEVDLPAFSDGCKQRWTSILDRFGGYASWDHGAVLTVESDPTYIVKLGFEDIELVRSGSGWSLGAELAKSVAKRASRGGLTPSGLLAVYLSGGLQSADLNLTQDEAAELWIEYASQLQSQRHIVASGVMLELLDQHGGDKSDEELESEQIEDAVVLAYLTYRQWRVILANDARGELLDVCAGGDADQLVAFLRDFKISVELVDQSRCEHGET